MTLSVAFGLFFSALLQASVSVFTSNSLATLEFARDRPDSVVYVGTNAYRASLFDLAVHPATSPSNLKFMAELVKSNGGQDANSGIRLVVMDRETLTWGRGEPYRRLEDLPKCWISDGSLTPRLRGVGSKLVDALAYGAHALRLPSAVESRLDALARPAPALVYRIPNAGC